MLLYLGNCIYKFSLLLALVYICQSYKFANYLTPQSKRQRFLNLQSLLQLIWHTCDHTFVNIVNYYNYGKNKSTSDAGMYKITECRVRQYPCTQFKIFLVLFKYFLKYSTFSSCHNF